MAAALCFLLLGFLPAALSLYGPLEHKIGLSDYAKFYIMCEHNRLRSAIAQGQNIGYKLQPKASNMQCLCWAEELVPKAQEHASNCGGPSHDARSGRSTVNFNDVGQSLMDCMPSAPIDEALEAFVEEANGYEYSTNYCDNAKAGRAKVCGHYTALVWATTQSLGCAYDACDGHAHGRLVCNYGPGGNLQGEKPYVEGAPCSSCQSGQSCLNGGLCCNCNDGQCGGSVTTASAPASACADKHTQCAAFKDHPSVKACEAGSPYRMWADVNCRATCGKCGSSNTGVFCSKALNISSQFCSVHSSENAAECKTGNGLFYSGTKSVTASGHACMEWATNDARTNFYHSFEFPERNKVKAKNYCRNPAASGTKPWCFTASGTPRWEYCDIPDC